VSILRAPLCSGKLSFALGAREWAYVRFGLDNPEPYRVLFMRKPTATPLPFQYEKIVGSARAALYGVAARD
jgi:hypothetical protein